MWCLRSFDSSVLLDTGPVKREVVLRLSQTRWKTGPSRCSCPLCKTGSISVGVLERLSMNLGANDTSICQEVPPIVTMEGRLRQLSCPECQMWSRPGANTLWILMSLGKWWHVHRMESSVTPAPAGLESCWTMQEHEHFAQSLTIQSLLTWHLRFFVQLQEEKRYPEASPHFGMLIRSTFLVGACGGLTWLRCKELTEQIR